MNTQTHNPETLRGEVYRLADALLAGEISPAEDRRLRQLVLENAEARRHYVRFMHDSALLGQWGGEGVESRESSVESKSISGQWPVVSGQREERGERREERESGAIVESAEWRVESESGKRKAESREYVDCFPEPRIPNPESPSINPQIPTLHSPLSTLHSWAFSYAVATLLVGIALLGAWFSTITHPDANSLLVNKNSRRVTPSGGTDKDSPQFTFVGKVSGMVDCRFADSSTETHPGAGVILGRRYALRSGLMEISYDSGAKVILQGPCEYTVESASGGFLKVGKLVARVGAGGERREESAKPQAAVSPSGNPKSRIPESPNPRSSNPQSLIPNPLFAVRTPTAMIEDLGTEFGVEVLESGETASHVFQGRVVMRTEGVREKGEGGETDGNKSEIRNHKSEIYLSAGQSARVERQAKSGELKLLSVGKNVAPPKFVRDIPRPERWLDLLDVVAGGNGWLGRREYGIDATSGAVDFEFAERRRAGEGHYTPVTWSKLIDGVFIPNGALGAVQLDSAGHTFDGFPETANLTYGSLWSRAAELDDNLTSDEQKHWIYRIGRCREFTPDNRGLLSFCPNVGVTFDLEAVRSHNAGLQPARLRAVLGMGDVRPYYPSAGNLADFWVFIDGQLKLKRAGLSPKDGAVKIEVELGPRDRFLTLVSTNAEGSRSCDWVVLGDPALQMISVKAEDRKEGK